MTTWMWLATGILSLVVVGVVALVIYLGVWPYVLIGAVAFAVLGFASATRGLESWDQRMRSSGGDEDGD